MRAARVRGCRQIRVRRQVEQQAAEERERADRVREGMTDDGDQRATAAFHPLDEGQRPERAGDVEPGLRTLGCQRDQLLQRRDAPRRVLAQMVTEVDAGLLPHGRREAPGHGPEPVPERSVEARLDEPADLGERRGSAACRYLEHEQAGDQHGRVEPEVPQLERPGTS
jgi:hypothetical protein